MRCIIDFSILLLIFIIFVVMIIYVKTQIRIHRLRCLKRRQEADLLRSKSSASGVNGRGPYTRTFRSESEMRDCIKRYEGVMKKRKGE